MNGFQGPFSFEIDKEGTEVPWDKVSQVVLGELEEEGKHNAENSKIYTFRIAVLEGSRRLEKHHDWASVSRVCIQAKIESSEMKLAGVSPRNKLASEARQHDLGLDATAEAHGSLFDLLKFKLTLSGYAKQQAHEHRYSVMNSFTKRSSQWIYSRAWPFLDFVKYLYVVVPNDLPSEKRMVKVSIKAMRKGNVELTQTGVFEAPIVLAV